MRHRCLLKTPQNTKVLCVVLADLPNDVILIIGKYLEPKDLNSFIQTARRFARLLDSQLYDHALTFKFETGTTVLGWAAENGLSSVVKKLLAKGEDISTLNPAGTTALHLAANMDTFQWPSFSLTPEPVFPQEICME